MLTSCFFFLSRAALRDDVTPGSFDRIQSKDNRTSHSAIHSVSPPLSSYLTEWTQRYRNGKHTVICFCRKQEAPRASRDEKRRAQHNEGKQRLNWSWCLSAVVRLSVRERISVTLRDLSPTVERRRRDKINNWIVQLSKAIPDCNVDYTKTGQVRRAVYSSDFKTIGERRHYILFFFFLQILFPE